MQSLILIDFDIKMMIAQRPEDQTINSVNDIQIGEILCDQTILQIDGVAGLQVADRYLVVLQTGIKNRVIIGSGAFEQQNVTGFIMASVATASNNFTILYRRLGQQLCDVIERQCHIEAAWITAKTTRVIT